MKKKNARGSLHPFVLNDQRKTWPIALRISLTFFAFGIAWILFSDAAADAAFGWNHALLVRISMVKGIVFVITSATIIYGLIAPALNRLSDAEQSLTESRDELKVMAYFDLLTGLANRRNLYDRFPNFLDDGTDRPKGILYIDVDNIKFVNDSLGHVFGDSLIVSIADRLRTACASGDQLFRLGGDEFILLAVGSSQEQFEQRANRVLSAFAAPFSIDKTSIHSTVSIGLALYPDHGKDAVELIKRSDVAMHRAKAEGKNRCVVFDEGMLTAFNRRLDIGERLHEALSRGELRLEYQPQVGVLDGRVSSFEALLRWENPTLGRVRPDIFIPVAEETRLIVPIGDWVLGEACRFLAHAHRAGHREVSIAVNASMVQILHEGFIDSVDRAISEAGIPPESLEIEITESVLMESYSLIQEQLEALRARGIGIALDDFGQGYSSLSYLDQLPITVLKIDKVFIDGITHRVEEGSITEDIVAIGKKLGLTVVAEGVETAEQLGYLASKRCDKIQGWIFSKALPAPEALAYLARSKV